MKTWAALFVGFALCGSAFAQEIDDAFARGNEEYRTGHFREAAELYAKAVEAGRTTAPLFYNQGNAWYRAGELSRAILSYERALALEPTHPEARANLQLARDKAHALQLKNTSWDQIIGRVQPKTYAIAGAVAFWIGAFSSVAWCLARRRSAALVALCFLAVLVPAGGVAAIYRLETGNAGSSRAIVLADKITARLATADTSGTVLVLPAGSEIRILSTRGEWTYAALPNDLRGWIPAASAERVRL